MPHIHDPSRPLMQKVPSGAEPLSVAVCRCGQIHVNHGSATLRLSQAEAGHLLSALRLATVALRSATSAPVN